MHIARVFVGLMQESRHLQQKYVEKMRITEGEQSDQ